MAPVRFEISPEGFGVRALIEKVIQILRFIITKSARIVYSILFTDLGLIDMFFTDQKAEIVVCMLLVRKSHHKPNLESTSKYGFPRFGGKMAAF